MASVQAFEEAKRNVREILSKHGVKWDSRDAVFPFGKPSGSLEGSVVVAPSEDGEFLSISANWAEDGGLTIGFDLDRDVPWRYYLDRMHEAPEIIKDVCGEFILLGTTPLQGEDGGFELDPFYLIEEEKALRIIDRMVALCMTPPATT